MGPGTRDPYVDPAPGTLHLEPGTLTWNPAPGTLHLGPFLKHSHPYISYMSHERLHEEEQFRSMFMLMFMFMCALFGYGVI